MGIGKQKSMSHFQKNIKNKMISSNIIQWTKSSSWHMLIDPFPYGSPRMIWKPTSSKKNLNNTQIMPMKTLLLLFKIHDIEKTHLKITHWIATLGDVMYNKKIIIHKHREGRMEK
jgi:hypothetical protein